MAQKDKPIADVKLPSHCTFEASTPMDKLTLEKAIRDNDRTIVDVIGHEVAHEIAQMILKKKPYFIAEKQLVYQVGFELFVFTRAELATFALALANSAVNKYQKDQEDAKKQGGTSEEGSSEQIPKEEQKDDPSDTKGRKAKNPSSDKGEGTGA